MPYSKYARLYGEFPPTSADGTYGGTVTLAPDPPYAADIFLGSTYPIQPITGYINKNGKLSPELLVPAISEGGIYPSGEWTWTLKIKRPWQKDPVVKHVVIRPGRQDINALQDVPVSLGGAGAPVASPVTVGAGKPDRNTPGRMFISTDGGGTGAWVWAKNGTSWTVVTGKTPVRNISIDGDSEGVFLVTVERTAEFISVNAQVIKEPTTTPYVVSFRLPDGFRSAFRGAKYTIKNQEFENRGSVTASLNGNNGVSLRVEGPSTSGVEAVLTFPGSSTWPTVI